MPGTRASARLAAQQGSSPQSSPQPAAGKKHKTDTGASPSSKRNKKSTGKRQKTLEESIPGNDKEEELEDEDQNGEATEEQGDGLEKDGDELQDEKKPADESGDEKKPDEDVAMKESEDKPEEVKEKDDMAEDAEAEKTTSTTNGDKTNGNTAVVTDAREKEEPSNVLEKGLVYFFFRGRVGVEDPDGVSDIARSYFILRPMPSGAKLGDGPIGDAGTNRLIALPKKVLPLSGKDRFMAFVEKCKVSFQTLKDEFLSSSDYETKTAGTRHTPAATPIGEGIYAITTTGRESHLAYMLTIPSEPDEVQKEMGLKERGSFIISTRNPDYPAPGNTQLSRGPEFPESIKSEFRSLRWTGTKPHHLDVPNCQFLLIGESSGLTKATEPTKEDAQSSEKEEPKEEMDQLEHEDELRVEGLKGDESEAIFRDLKVGKEGLKGLKTTF